MDNTKCLLRHRYLGRDANDESYLTLCVRTGEPFLGVNYLSESEMMKKRFTASEIEEIKQRFKTDLLDYEIIEVEEWHTKK